MSVTLPDLETQYRTRQLAAERSKAAAEAGLRQILAAAKSQSRSYMTAAETTRAQGYERDLIAARGELDACALALAEVGTARADEDRITAAQSSYRATAVSLPARTASLSIGRSERTYRPDEDPLGLGFLRDIARGQVFGDPTARERLARHTREEETERGLQLQQRASTSTNFSGLVVPQYLTDFFAPAVAAMRPFADICTPHPLPPEGMSISFGRLSTTSSVALQANQGDTIATADPDDSLVTENVLTAAGSVLTSRQSVDRGVFTDDRILEDLLRRSATVLDNTLLNQATTGADALANSTTTSYTTTQPTAVGLWPKLFSAQNNIETALLQQAPPSHFILAPRRWNWLTSQVSSSWPLFGAASVPAQMAGMVLTNEYGPAVRAVLANGMKIVVDGNVVTNQGAGTNQDAIYCVAAGEFHLWEDPAAPVYIRAEQPAATALQILFVAFSYFAFCGRRYPGAVQSITGTGLVTPTFI